MCEMQKALVVIGGNGALGRALIAGGARSGLGTVCLERPGSANVEAGVNVSVQSETSSSSWTATAEALRTTLAKHDLSPIAVAVAAGSWAGGGITAPDGGASIGEMLEANFQVSCPLSHAPPLTPAHLPPIIMLLLFRFHSQRCSGLSWRAKCWAPAG